MLGKDAIEPLANKLLDKSNTKAGQFLIVESMGNIAHTHKSSRKKIIDIFCDALNYDSKENTHLNTGILLNLLQLGVMPDKAIPEIEKAMIAEYDMFDQDNPHFSTLPVNTQIGFGKIGRNDKCPCGSGKKFKKCCIDDDVI